MLVRILLSIFWLIYVHYHTNITQIMEKIMKNWIYDEYKHCGVDYSDVKIVSEYDDDQHQSFRDYK